MQAKVQYVTKMHNLVVLHSFILRPKGQVMRHYAKTINQSIEVSLYLFNTSYIHYKFPKVAWLVDLGGK